MSPQTLPDVDLLRVEGWKIISEQGIYCSAWRGSQQTVFIWTPDGWEQLVGI